MGRGCARPLAHLLNERCLPGSFPDGTTGASGVCLFLLWKDALENHNANNDFWQELLLLPAFSGKERDGKERTATRTVAGVGCATLDANDILTCGALAATVVHRSVRKGWTLGNRVEQVAADGWPVARCCIEGERATANQVTSAF